MFLLKMAFSLSIIVEHSGIGLLPHDSMSLYQGVMEGVGVAVVW